MKTWVFIIFLIFIIILLACFLVILVKECSAENVMLKMLNYSRESIIDKESFFKMSSRSEFYIYPQTNNSFKVVYIKGGKR